MYTQLAGPPTKRRRADFSDFPRVKWNETISQSQFNIIAINYSDTREQVQEFAAEFNLTMPLVLGGAGEDSVANKFGVMAYPTNYIVDSNGIVVAQYVGYDEKGIKSTLSQYGVTK